LEQGWVAILMPVLLLGVIFYFSTKSDKAKYQAMVDISKNLENESDIKDLLENFNEKKKPMDYRRNGVITDVHRIRIIYLWSSKYTNSKRSWSIDYMYWFWFLGCRVIYTPMKAKK
jgi:hypothetical protein